MPAAANRSANTGDNVPFPLTNYVRARIVYYTAFFRECELIAWYAFQGQTPPPSPASAEGIATALSAAFNGEVKNCLVNQGGYVGCATTLHLGQAIYPALSRSNSGPGLVSGDQSPDQVAVVIRKYGGGGGRSGNGRWYMGGVPEIYTTANKLTPAAIGAYDALGDQLIANVVVPDPDVILTPLHYSRALNQTFELEGRYTQEFLKRQDRRLFRTLME